MKFGKLSFVRWYILVAIIDTFDNEKRAILFYYLAFQSFGFERIQWKFLLGTCHTHYILYLHFYFNYTISITDNKYKKITTSTTLWLNILYRYIMFGRGICKKYQSRDETFPEPNGDGNLVSRLVFFANTPPKHDISV